MAELYARREGQRAGSSVEGVRTQEAEGARGNGRRWGLARLVVLCLAIALLSTMSSAAAAPTVATMPARVPVRVCAEDRDWYRPEPREMARTVWRDSRYINVSI